MTQINLTSTADVTLKTAGKYCEDDIKIVQNLEEITATPTDEVQEFVPSEGKNGISRFVVNEILTEDVEVKSTEDTELVMPSDGKFIRKVTVKKINLQNKSVTPSKESQTIVKDGGFDALKIVKVEPIPEEYVVPEGSLDISQNGTYDVTSLKSVVVNIVGDGGAIVPMEVNLPEGFRQKANYYYLQMSGSKILMSNQDSESGLWEYNVKSKVWTKIYAGGDFRYFQKVDNYCLVGGHSGYLLLYSEQEGQIVQAIEKTSSWSTFDLVGDNYFCYARTSGAGLCVYDTKSKQLILLSDKGISWVYKIKAGDDYIVSSSSNNTTGLYLYEPSTNRFTKIVENSKYGYEFAYDVSDNIMLISSNNSSGKGVIVYDKSTKTAQTSNWSAYSTLTIKHIEEDVYLASCYSSFTKGALLFNASDKSFTQIYAIGYNWQNVFVINDVYLMTTSSVSGSGVVMYDKTTQTTTQVYAGGNNFSRFEKVGNNCVISGSASYGVLLFDGETKTISQIEAKGYVNIFSIGDVCLLAGTSYSAYGVKLYDNSTREVTSLLTDSTAGYANNVFVQTNNDVLIGSDGSNGKLLLYNGDAKTITLLQTSGYYSIFHDVGDGNYLISRNTSGGNHLLLYNSTDKTATNISPSGTYFLYCYKLRDGKYLLTSEDSRYGVLYNPSANTVKGLEFPKTRLEVKYEDSDGDCFLSYSGLVLYNLTTESIDDLFAVGGKYDTFAESDEKIMISANNKEESIYTLEYDKATKTAELVSVYVS